jgi:SP family sugar:H+ symporter-like MFS transporter
MALATASNWVFNFLISFFTPYITSAIDYRYGYVFAGCCFAGAVVVYLFVCESHGRSLEEIDTMYILGVTPWKSKNWHPTPGEDLPNLDSTYLTPGARGIKKRQEARAPEQSMREEVPVTEADMLASGARQ